MIVFNEQEYSKEALKVLSAAIENVMAACIECQKSCAQCPLEELTNEALEARNALLYEINNFPQKNKGMGRKEILDAASRCVCGEREQDYGTPDKNFELISELWTTYLKAKCVSPKADVCINGEDIATMMCLFKIARIATGRGKADSFIDLAGYAACAGELATGGGAE